MKLVADWKQAWRWFSVQIVTVLAIMPVLYENVEIVKNFLSPSAFSALVSILAVLAALGRLVAQPK